MDNCNECWKIENELNKAREEERRLKEIKCVSCLELEKAIVAHKSRKRYIINSSNRSIMILQSECAIQLLLNSKKICNNVANVIKEHMRVAIGKDFGDAVAIEKDFWGAVVAIAEHKS